MKSVKGWIHSIEKSALWTIIGIVLLFSTAIIVTLIAPQYVDPSWTEPSSPYQVQIYEYADPNLYVSSAFTRGQALQYVRHLRNGKSFIAFQDQPSVKIMAPDDLKEYINGEDAKELKLTTRLLLLRKPTGEFAEKAEERRKQLQEEWEEKHPNWRERGLVKIDYQILELYDPKKEEAFALSPTAGVIENWVDENFIVLDEVVNPEMVSQGVIYDQNPQEYLVSEYLANNVERLRYDPINGRPLKSLEELKSPALGFWSRKELIEIGEHIFAIEGCWYCHTDQTRTLIQDTVLNGSDSFPAPPSSPNEYIYQYTTFPGTRRIGPDLSRVGIKRPNRDWHASHFWSPRTASAGSVMPSFKHFFDEDPSGKNPHMMGIPNYQFEAIFQYLMTKGTRITAPTQAWWLGKDPVNTIGIIEGRKKFQ